MVAGRVGMALESVAPAASSHSSSSSRSRSAPRVFQKCPINSSSCPPRVRRCSKSLLRCKRPRTDTKGLPSAPAPAPAPAASCDSYQSFAHSSLSDLDTVLQPGKQRPPSNPNPNPNLDGNPNPNLAIEIIVQALSEHHPDSLGTCNRLENGNKWLDEFQESLSAEEIVVVARLTAALAAKKAVEARALANTRALVASEAAIFARAAIKAAVIAACQEQPEKLRSLRQKPRHVVTQQDQDESTEKRNSLLRVGDMAVHFAEEETKVNVVEPKTMDNDKELARELHRAMNSSPRISYKKKKHTSEEEDRKPLVLTLCPSSKGSHFVESKPGLLGKKDHGALHIKEFARRECRSSSQYIETDELAENVGGDSPLSLFSCGGSVSAQRIDSSSTEFSAESKAVLGRRDCAENLTPSSYRDDLIGQEDFERGGCSLACLGSRAPHTVDGSTEPSHCSGLTEIARSEQVNTNQAFFKLMDGQVYDINRKLKDGSIKTHRLQKKARTMKSSVSASKNAFRVARRKKGIRVFEKSCSTSGLTSMEMS